MREYACTGDLRVFCDLQYAFPIEAPHHVGTNRYLQLPTPTSSGAGAAGALFSRLATKGVCQCASVRALGTCATLGEGWVELTFFWSVRSARPRPLCAHVTL